MNGFAMDALTKEDLAVYSPIVLRLGLAAVTLWFGLSELIDPSLWTIYAPAWTMSVFGLPPLTVVYLNATSEIIAGILLSLGAFVRPVAFELFIHLLIIISVLGITAVGVRDIGLAFAFLSLAFYGPDELSLLKD